MEKLSRKPQKNIASTVHTLISPTADGLGYQLWDVEYVKEGAEMILRITIDKDGGISIDDCEKMHRAIDPILDEADPIECSYRLEVSSPGVERVLKTDAHIDACLGYKVEVKLFAPLEDGRKTLTGKLLGHNDDGIGLELEGEGDVTVPRSAVAKMQTVFDWDNNE